MRRISDKRGAEPRPMDWILEARAYGMKIRYATTAPGTVDWNREVVRFREMGLSMPQLRRMLGELVREARELLEELTMARGQDVDGLAKMAWDDIEEVHSRAKVGYSLISDEGNVWLKGGNKWVVRHIVQCQDRVKEWMQDADEGKGR